MSNIYIKEYLISCPIRDITFRNEHITIPVNYGGIIHYRTEKRDVSSLDILDYYGFKIIEAKSNERERTIECVIEGDSYRFSTMLEELKELGWRNCLLRYLRCIEHYNN